MSVFIQGVFKKVLHSSDERINAYLAFNVLYLGTGPWKVNTGLINKSKFYLRGTPVVGEENALIVGNIHSLDCL